MTEKEKSRFATLAANVDGLVANGMEDTVLAITASYLAGKEAGRRESKKSE